MPDIRLIALDLDGTLLNSQKELSGANAQALDQAAAKGIHIVPTTGRFFGGMPQVIRDLPYLRYVISINGARVTDIVTEEILYRAEIPCIRAIEIMTELDKLDVIYDCYQNNWGWMTCSLWEKAAEYAPNSYYLQMIRELRTPVKELKAYLMEKNEGVQKVQFFARDVQTQKMLLEIMTQQLPDIVVSSSVKQNIELNSLHANKGEAIEALTAHLGISMDSVMALGDGSNDVSMLQMAGFGVCMENGCVAAKTAAKYHTDSCDRDGVAKAIKKFCL